VVAIPLVSLFVAIRRHYEYVAERLSIQATASKLCSDLKQKSFHPAVVVIGQLKGTLEALTMRAALRMRLLLFTWM